MAVKRFSAEERPNIADELRDSNLPNKTTKKCALATITTPEGEVFEIAETPANLGRAAALAGEQTLRKLWDNPQEDEAWRTMAEEI